MRQRACRAAAAAVTMMLAGSCHAGQGQPAAQAPDAVLVFAATDDAHRDATAAGIQAIQELGAANDFTVTVTTDPGTFAGNGLSRFAAVTFLNAPTDALDAAGRAAFERYVRGGGG